MNRLIAFWKKLQLRQVITVFLAGLLLIVSTACNQVNAQAPNPQNAAPSRDSRLLYPGAETPQGRAEKEARLPIITEKNFRPKEGGLNQRDPDLGSRVEGRIETVKEAVKDASGFIKEKSDEASSRPELQKNPAFGK